MLAEASKQDPQAHLRRDIRELGVLLGRTLVRQEGARLLELVEEVRHLIRTDRDATAALLADVDPGTAIRLVRAFTTYFHLANVAEQVHRGRELAAIRRRQGTWLSQAIERIAASGIPSSELAAEVGRLAVRPVFTAHPTEAARRTVLAKLRRGPGPPARARDPRRAGAGRRVARGPVVVGAHRGGDERAPSVARGRPRAAAGARRALPPAERRGAVPAEAHLRAAKAPEHAPPAGTEPAPRAGARLPRRRRAARGPDARPRLPPRPPRRAHRPRAARERNPRPCRLPAPPCHARRPRARRTAPPCARPTDRSARRP